MFKDDKVGIGYGMLGLFQDPAFVAFNGKAWTLDETFLKKHLKAMANAGANFVRVLPWGVWGPHKYGRRSQFQPYVLNVDKNLWDLATFNAYYFPIVKRVFEIINGLNLTVLWDWFCNCQFHGGTRKWSPWYSNVQGITSFYGKDADKYTRRWLSTTILRYGYYDVIWGFGNELENRAAPDFVKRVIFPFIKAKNLPFDHLTYGATTKIVAGDSNQDIIRNAVEDTFGKDAERSIFMEDHGWPFTASLPIWGKKPWRKIYSDDGYYDALDNRPSPTAWGAKAKFILTNYYSAARPQIISFEHLPPKGDHSKPEREAAAIRAISAAYKGKFRTWPTNYGKHP